MYPVIVCIAKKEKDYIEEFIQYHLGLGFSHIYLYDNEDTPTYASLLQKYTEFITVFHLPFNTYTKPVQYHALDIFTKTVLPTSPATHVAHIDIDEFIVLKKHRTIREFAKEYFVDTCEAIAMNWRAFGSSGKTEQTAEPVTQRFTMCGEKGNPYVKVFFKRESFMGFGDCHYVWLNRGYTKTTSGTIVSGSTNHDIDFSVIQLNHYKCKTLPEFRYIRTRQRADVKGDIRENVETSFKKWDINEVEDLSAYRFAKSIGIF
jgi:hypothetical protein